MKNLNLFKSFGLVSGALCLIAAPQALAQTAGEQPSTVNDIVVTAQFREQRLQDTPIAISAIPAELLEEKNLTDIVGAANLAPNVTLSRGAGAFGQFASVFVRGVGQSDIHFAVEPGVGMYVDDIYYGVMSGAVFNLLDAERVEVLRGPQGTLAGKNSIGGAIKLFSRRPGPETDGYAELTYGELDLVGGRAAGNFTIVDDRLYGRIAIAGRRQDGYLERFDYACVTGNTAAGTQRLRQDCSLGTQGGQEVWTARASLRWIVSDRIEDTLIFDTVQDRSENPASKLLVQSPLWTGGANYITPPESYTNYEDYISRPTGPAAGAPFVMPSETPLDGDGFTNLLSIELSGTLRLDLITGYRESVVPLSTTLDASPASVLDQYWRLSHQQFTQEARLSGDIGDFAEWTLGAYYYDADGVSEGRVNIPGGLAPGGGGLNLDILFRDPVETESKSVFAHTVLHPTERLGVTLAVRYTEDSKSFTFNRWDINGNPHPLLGALLDLTREFSGERTDYRVGLDYQWTDNFMTYAQVSTGYKGGGVNPRPFFVSQAQLFAPETLTAYEIGVKSQFFDRRVTLNAAAFFNEYKDLQGTLLRCDAFSPFPGAPCTMTANIGDADITGFEFEAALQPVDGLSIDLSAGWLEFEYQEVNAATLVTLDMTNLYTPDFTAAIGAQYEFKFGAGALTPRIDYNYRSEIFTDAINAPVNRLGGIGLANARLTWRDAEEAWEASLAVTNLTDEFYYESQQLRADPPYFAGTGRPGVPRLWSITIRRNF